MMNLALVFVILAVAEGYSRSGFASRVMSRGFQVNSERSQMAPKNGCSVGICEEKIVSKLPMSHNQAGSKTRVYVSQQENPMTQEVDGTGYTDGGVDDKEIFVPNILGDMNFCLRSTDGALTGPTRSKLLNSLTNNVFKAIVIGSESEVKRVLHEFDDYRIKVGQCANNGTQCDFETRPADVMPVPPTDFDTSASDAATSASLLVTDAGEELNMTPLSEEEDLTLAQTYIDTLEVLLQAGELRDTQARDTESERKPTFVGSMYDRGYRRLLTLLKDAGCRFYESGGGRPLPAADQNICLSIMDSMLSDDEPSVTRELNRISNVVSRAMLYGSKKEKDSLAGTLMGHVPTFISQEEYSVGPQGQEVTYLRALAYLLEHGLGPAQEQITGQLSNTGAFGESVIGGGVGSVSVESEGSLRLYDAYTNAFQRLVEVCVGEIAARRVPTATAQDDDFLLNFVLWEQSLRRNLTADMWAPNPKELAGDWELIDISGMGTLTSVMVSDPDIYFGMKKGVRVQLLGDGRVDVDYPESVGQRWFFKPGPAHLDTCEFSIFSEKDSTVELKYTGFIDRGQRIESRFSQQPIRMTGRVVSSIAGDLQGSCRFIMAKRR